MEKGERGLQLHDAVVGANVENLAAKLVGQTGDGIEMLVLVTEGLAGRQVARVVFRPGELGDSVLGAALGEFTGGGDLAMVLEQLFEELGAQDADLREEQFALDEGRLGVIEDGPDGDEIVELATGLLDDTVLTLQDDGHAGQIFHLGVADDETVDVETARGEDPGHAGQHTGLVLHQAVQDMAFGRVGRRHGGLVQDGRDGRGGIPLGRGIRHRQRQGRATVKGLVSQRGG